MDLTDWTSLEDRPRPQSVEIQGTAVGKGDRVRLWPAGVGADIMDLAMTGKVAIVESIEQDYEGNVHLAVVLEDDPGRDLGEMRQPGHRFFFAPREVEPMGPQVASSGEGGTK